MFQWSIFDLRETVSLGSNSTHWQALGKYLASTWQVLSKSMQAVWTCYILAIGLLMTIEVAC